MSIKRIILVVVAGLAFVGGIVLLVLRQGKLAGLLRAAAEGALIKHDLQTLRVTRDEVLTGSDKSSDKVIALNHLIVDKEREAITKPLKLKGATDEEIDNELRAAGLLR